MHFYDYYGMSFHILGFRLRLKRQANAAAILASGKNKLPLTNILLVELALFKKQVQGKPFLIPDYLPILALDRFEQPVRERRVFPYKTVLPGHSVREKGEVCRTE